MIVVLALCLAGAAGAFPGETAYLQAGAELRAGRYAEAAEAYRGCAAVSSPLAPYATAQVVVCLARGGNLAAAEAAYEILRREHPDGPWRWMAQAARAEALRKAKRYAEAAPLFQRVLAAPVQPWWMDSLSWQGANTLFLQEERRSEALAWYREKVDSVRLIKERRDAAERLLESMDRQDRALGVLGLLRAGSYKDATKAILSSPFFVAAGEGGRASFTEVAGLVQGALPESSAARLRRLAAANLDDLWMRVWLVYGMRMQAMQKRFDAATVVCDVLVTAYPESREAGEGLWWLARYAEREGQANRATALYERLAKDCPDHYRADDALFALGMGMITQGNRMAAEKMLLDMTESFPDSSLRAEAYYRCGRIRESATDPETASEHFRHAAKRGLGNFYAHRAMDRIASSETDDARKSPPFLADGVQAFVRPLPGLSEPPHALPEKVAADVRLQRLAFFGAHGLTEGEWEALGLCQALAGEADPGPWYEAMAAAGYYHTARQFVTERDWGMGSPPFSEDRVMSAERRRFEYPRAYWPMATAMGKATGLDPYLLLAVARQESTFRAGVRSHAGAAGVMQLMPPTAKWLARVEPNVTKAHAAHLGHPGNSLRLGAYYLMRMVDRSDGNLVYALASYNAGPGNCDKWRKRFPNHDTEAFIQAIPFSETKGYVKRVLGNYAAYRSIYP